MPTLCPRIAQFLLTASPERLVDYLCEEVSDEAEGRTAMDWLGEQRIAVRNRVLCYVYDIACYHVGTSCFADSEPAENQDKWFVSVVSGSELDLQGHDVPLADSREAAEALAVETYGLVDKFFGRVSDTQPA